MKTTWIFFCFALLHLFSFGQENKKVAIYAGGSINKYLINSKHVDGIVSSTFPLSLEFQYNPKLAIGPLLYLGFFNSSILTDRDYSGGQLNAGLSHRITLKESEVLKMYHLTHLAIGRYNVKYRDDASYFHHDGVGYQAGMQLGILHYMMSDYGNPLNFGFFLQSGFYHMNYSLNTNTLNNTDIVDHVDLSSNLKAFNLNVTMGMIIHLTKKKDFFVD